MPRTRTTTKANAEVAHGTCALCHFGDIALLAGKQLEFDSETERFTNDDESSALLTKSYREPYGLPAST